MQYDSAESQMKAKETERSTEGIKVKVQIEEGVGSGEEMC